MYIQITTRCNMECAHCCFACTAKGKDMSMKTFIKACDIAEDFGQYISLGGGEPTVHPLFWQFLGVAIGRADEGVVWLATNGKRKADALRLSRLAHNGSISVTLSLDRYHEPIDPQVSKAFESPEGHKRNNKDNREIRTVTRLCKHGRAVDIDSAREDLCRCDEWFVTTEGDMYMCGCLTHKIGNVHDKDIMNIISGLDEIYGHNLANKENDDE